MNKIKIVSTFFNRLFLAMMIIIPIMQVIAWVYAPQELSFLAHMVVFSVVPREYEILHPLSFEEKMLGFIVSSLPMLVELGVLYCLHQLFKCYAKGDIFSLQTIQSIRHAAYALLLTQVVHPIYEGMMGFVLTWHNPAGHRYAKVTFDQTNIGLLLMALLLILVSWIMTEACKLNEDHQFTI